MCRRIVADNNHSVTERSFRPYMAPRGNEHLPNSLYYADSAFVRGKILHRATSSEVYNIFCCLFSEICSQWQQSSKPVFSMDYILLTPDLSTVCFSNFIFCWTLCNCCEYIVLMTIINLHTNVSWQLDIAWMIDWTLTGEGYMHWSKSQFSASNWHSASLQTTSAQNSA